jgi:hypothetical protein
MSHDQSAQYLEFLQGKKPLCVIERRKDAETFDCAFSHLLQKGHYDAGIEYHLHLWHSPEGVEIVLAHDVADICEYFEHLNDAGAWELDRASMQRQLGIMFGYSDADVAEYAANWTPDYCQCSKCIGIHAALAADTGE